MPVNEPVVPSDPISSTPVNDMAATELPVVEIPVVRTSTNQTSRTGSPAGECSPEEPVDSAQRWRSAMKGIGRTASTTHRPERQLFDAAVLAAKTLQTDLFGYSHVDRQGNHVMYVGDANDAAAHSAAANCVLPEEKCRSIARFAADGPEPVAVTDLAGETRFADAFLQQHGVAGALVCPMTPGDGTGGTIGVYCVEPRRFSDDDVLLLESITRVVFTNIARLQAVESLAEKRQLSTSLLETLDAAVIALSPEGRIEWVNRACRDATGYVGDELTGRAIWSALLLPEEADIVNDAFQSLRAGENPVRFETGILTKRGERRRIAWSFTQLTDADGAVESLVGTGIDVTRQCELFEQFEQAEQAADEARRALEGMERSGQEVTTPEEEPSDSELPAGIAHERRHERRRDYPFIQRVAPKFGMQTPDLDTFEQVQCHNISAHGFAYYHPEPPDSEEVVVALGNHPTLVYLIARVAHVTAMEFEGRDTYLIGCKYTSRARYK